MNHPMAETLLAHFEGLRRNTDVRVVILRGAGRAFSSGADLKGAARRSSTSTATTRGTHLEQAQGQRAQAGLTSTTTSSGSYALTHGRSGARRWRR